MIEIKEIRFKYDKPEWSEFDAIAEALYALIMGYDNYS